LIGGYLHESGRILRIKVSTLDTGDGSTSDAAYKYVRAARAVGIPIMAGKGARDTNAEIFSTPKAVDPNQDNTKAAKYGLRVYNVGTNRAKDLILGNRLKLDGDGPGRMHFSRDRRDDYLKQVTSEVKVPGRTGQRAVYQKKPADRNEALDCEVYALHAARSVKLHLFTEAHWVVEEARHSQPSLFEAVQVITCVPEQEGETLPVEAVEGADTADESVSAAATAVKPAVPVNPKPPPRPAPNIARPPVRRMSRSSYLKGR
jgi:phage terminase large subunit GpA-like protein